MTLIIEECFINLIIRLILKLRSRVEVELLRFPVKLKALSIDYLVKSVQVLK